MEYLQSLYQSVNALADNKAGEIIFQFLLVTAFGGSIGFFIQAARDRRERREAKLTAIRSMVAQIDEFYRSAKHIKRSVRARWKSSDTGWEVEAAYFAARMDELGRIQLSLEQFAQMIRTRLDLFTEFRHNRIREEIGYAEAYFEDIIDEFQDRDVTLLDGRYLICPARCPVLRNYLDRQTMPPSLRKGCNDIGEPERASERYAALQRFNAIAKDVDPKSEPLAIKRYRQVADECMLMVLLELREAMNQHRRSTAASIQDFFSRLTARAAVRATTHQTSQAVSPPSP